MVAQSQRMNIVASNMANADSAVTPGGQPYRAQQPVFQVQPLAAGAAVGGVKVTEVLPSTAPAQLQYDPNHPLADEEGFVAMPNVDIVAETVNMISAARSYQANVEVINTSKALMARTLTIGQ